MMKKNKMMRAATGMLIAALLTTSVISGTFAKYTTSVSAEDKAVVAKWSVKATVGGNAFGDSSKTIDLFKVGEVYDTKDVTSFKDATGTADIEKRRSKGKFHANRENQRNQRPKKDKTITDPAAASGLCDRLPVAGAAGTAGEAAHRGDSGYDRAGSGAGRRITTGHLRTAGVYRRHAGDRAAGSPAQRPDDHNLRCHRQFPLYRCGAR